MAEAPVADRLDAGPYRARAPHPDAKRCPCGWRHPTKFHPTIEVIAAAPVRLGRLRIVFTCPDCGLEHVAADEA